MSTRARWMILGVSLVLLVGCKKDDSNGGGGPGAAPRAPTAVTAVGGTGRVTLDWNASTGASSYNIYFDVTPGVTKATGTQIVGASKPYTHSSLSNGTAYYYVVTALNSSNESVESAEVSAMPVAVPTGLTALEGWQGALLDWLAVPGAALYNVYWSTTPGVSSSTGNPILGVSPPFYHPGLTNGVTYHYVVTGWNLVGGGAVSDDSAAVSATPHDGALDLTFGGRGWVTHHDAAGGDGWDEGYAITVDGFGRILVTGRSAGLGSDRDMVIWAYTPDGDLDPSMNGQGWVTHDSAAGGGGWDFGMDIAVDGWGRIVVAGASSSPLWLDDMAVWRYDWMGQLDPLFAGQGYFTHNAAAGANDDDTGRAMACDVFGRIVVAGSSVAAAGDDDMVVWRFREDGTLDTTFDVDGWLTHHDAAGGGWSDRGRAVVIDIFGRILVAGHSEGPTSSDDMVVWRFNADGSLDGTFGGQGWIVHHDAAGGDSWDYGLAMAEDPTGRILVTGYSEGFSTLDDMVIWRLNTDGSLDTTFGGQGWVVHDNAAGGNGSDWGHGIALDPSGRILVTGRSENAAPDWDMVIWRYDDTGALDTVFDGRGWVVHHDAAGGNYGDGGYDVTVDALGRILVAGWSTGPATGEDMVIWRYR